MIDWYAIVMNIQSVMPLQRASMSIGMNRDYLRTLRNFHTTEPGFTVGLKLLRLHAKACGREKHIATLRKTK